MGKIFPYIFTVCSLVPIGGRRCVTPPLFTPIDTIAISTSLPPSWDTLPPVDSGAYMLLVDKSERIMAAVCGSSLDTVRLFNVRTGLNYGGKERYGDKKTPNGIREIISLEHHARYKYFLRLDYPNKNERAAGNTGDGIGIHFLGRNMTSNIVRADGSSGCITVWDVEEIRWLYANMRVGSKVVIRE